MAYVRVTMIKSDVSFKDALKSFRGSDREATLKAADAESMEMIQTGENSGMLISKYANKTKANKAWKASAAARAWMAENQGAVVWPVEGPTKWKA